MARPHLKKLLVEGEEDKRVIPELMEANGIPWGPTPDHAPAFIQPYDGIDNLLKPGLIATELKASGLQTLGIIADADEDAMERWRRIRSRCLPYFPGIPEALPETGLIQANASGLTLGIWIMPDNRLRGMLETFLAYLVPSASQAVWSYASEAFGEAQERGARCKAVHADKARIHTWLAWQDPPGRPLHNAVMERILDPRMSYAQRFVSWFRSLYQL